MNNNNLNYLENESTNNNINNLESFIVSLNNKKYIIILNFINSLLKFEDHSKLKSLTQFKNITINNILSYGESHILNIINNYTIQLIEIIPTFKFKYNSSKDLHKQLLCFIRKLLKYINYKLTSKKTNNNIFYTIITK
jgi:hypothetical protein